MIIGRETGEVLTVNKLTSQEVIEYYSKTFQIEKAAYLVSAFDHYDSVCNFRQAYASEPKNIFVDIAYDNTQIVI